MNTSTPDHALLAEKSGSAPDDVIVGSTQPPIPGQRFQLPATVRRAPRLWSLLYDELSASDQRWVLDTIARHGQA